MSIGSIPYDFPPPAILNLEMGADVAQICEKFQTRLDAYCRIQERLVGLLNTAGGTNIQLGEDKTLRLSDFVKNVCVDSDEANRAYKFYGGQIIDKINLLGKYINQINAILNDAAQLAKDPHACVVQMEMLDRFCEEIWQEFRVQYQYDFDEDGWVRIEDIDSQLTGTNGAFSKFSSIQNLQVKADSKGNSVKKTIDIFRELNLIDRLKYIKLYYDIQSGKSDSVFIEDPAVGAPCIREDYSTYKCDQDNKKMAALEQFYIGYLVDRDGAANTLSNFFDIKVTALNYNISLASQHVRALNQYMNWLNLAMDRLNESQSSGKAPIPAACYMLLHNVCNSVMRATMKLDLDKDGVDEEYVVIENARPESAQLKTTSDGYHLQAQNRYVLVKVGSEGMNYILNGGSNPAVAQIQYFDRPFFDAANTVLGDVVLNTSNYTVYHGFCYPGYYDCRWSDQVYVLTFPNDQAAKTFLPKECGVRRIEPNSVKGAGGGWNETIENDNDSTARLQSWQNAFQSAIDAINASVKTVETDIQNLRTKIDTYTTLGNTFRNRTFDVYSKATANMRK